jgi:hypothetical protein
MVYADILRSCNPTVHAALKNILIFVLNVDKPRNCAIFNVMDSLAADGVFEGVAIGGDRYPGTSFMDHIMRYQNQERYRAG